MIGFKGFTRSSEVAVSFLFGEGLLGMHSCCPRYHDIQLLRCLIHNAVSFVAIMITLV